MTLAAAPASAMLLDVRGLKKHFPIRRGLLQKTVGQVKAVDDVTFFVHRGETLSLVGESGCGKTTTARCILRAITPTAGEVLLRDNDEVIDVATVPKERLRPLRRQMQMIFQDPFSSLNHRPRRRAAAARGPATGIHAPLPARLLGRAAPAHRHRPSAGPQSAADRGG
jgi:ABC-type oligopeptide transport system ATPase subunit